MVVCTEQVHLPQVCDIARNLKKGDEATDGGLKWRRQGDARVDCIRIAGSVEMWSENRGERFRNRCFRWLQAMCVSAVLCGCGMVWMCYAGKKDGSKMNGCE